MGSGSQCCTGAHSDQLSRAALLSSVFGDVKLVLEIGPAGSMCSHYRSQPPGPLACIPVPTLHQSRWLIISQHTTV